MRRWSIVHIFRNKIDDTKTVFDEKHHSHIYHCVRMNQFCVIVLQCKPTHPIIMDCSTREMRRCAPLENSFLVFALFHFDQQIYRAVHWTLNIGNIVQISIQFPLGIWTCSKAYSHRNEFFAEKLLLFRKRGRWMKKDENGNGSDIRYRSCWYKIFQPYLF